MVEKTELLPCPFCGAQPEYLSVPGGMWVRCPECKASSDDSAALQKWNRRVTLNPASSATEGVELVARLRRSALHNGHSSDAHVNFCADVQKAADILEAFYASPPNAEPAPVVKVDPTSVANIVAHGIDLGSTPAAIAERILAALSLPVEGAAKEGKV